MASRAHNYDYGLFAAIGVALAVTTAFTTPFTWPADEVVIAGFALVLALWAARAIWPRPAPIEVPADPSAQSARYGWHWAPLLAVVGASVGWELYCLFSEPRSAHPTFSSIGDLINATHVGHGITFGLWLFFGWFLVRR